MSVLIDSIDKSYIDRIIDSPICYHKISLQPYRTTLATDEPLQGYAHSIYYPLECEAYARLRNGCFSDAGNRQFVVYRDGTNKLHFSRFDGSTDTKFNKNKITQAYEHFTIHDTKVFTMDYNDLIYSIDKIDRYTEQDDLEYEIFKHSVLVSRGQWSSRDNGILYLGCHYIQPSFRFPLSTYLRKKLNIYNESRIIANKDQFESINVHENLNNFDDITADERDRKILSYFEKTEVIYFIMLLVNHSYKTLYNTEALCSFMKNFSLP